MYSRYFHSAEKHLRAAGMEPKIQKGHPVSDADLYEVERAIQQAIPPELRLFFKEMGDGFSFSPEPTGGFAIGWLADFRKNSYFIEVLREEASEGSNREHSAEEVARELARREKWFPFFGFGGGGYLFCLDLNYSPSPVRYYERIYWPNDPVDHWQLSMADSFEDFIAQWSRYCFASAKGASLMSVALSAKGRFDWSPSRFMECYDRGATTT